MQMINVAATASPTATNVTDVLTISLLNAVDKQKYLVRAGSPLFAVMTDLELRVAVLALAAVWHAAALLDLEGFAVPADIRRTKGPFPTR